MFFTMSFFDKASTFSNTAVVKDYKYMQDDVMKCNKLVSTWFQINYGDNSEIPTCAFYQTGKTNQNRSHNLMHLACE